MVINIVEKCIKTAVKILGKYLKADASAAGGSVAQYLADCFFGYLLT